MSDRPSSAFATGLGALLRLEWRRARRSRRLRVGAVAAGLVAVAGVGARYASEAEPTVTLAGTLGLGLFSLLVYLLPFLFCAGALAEEVENHTLAYLLARPVGRSAIVLAKYLVGAGISVGLVAATALLLHLGCLATDPATLVDALPDTGRAVGAVALLAALYGAVCLFWGSLATEAAGVVSALYLGVVEFTVGFAPGVFRLLSMNHHASELAGLPRGGLLPNTVPTVPPAASLTALLAETALFLLLAVVTVRASEYRIDRA